MATLDNWFNSAKERGLDLEKHIKIDQQKDLKRLKESGLPLYELIIINGLEFNSKKTKDFISRFEMVWCRAINKSTQKREYKLGIKSFEEFLDFIKSLPGELKDLILQVFEYHENIFGGNIISSENKTVIEIVEGTQDNVSKSLKPFFHGQIINTGRLEFTEKEVPLEIKKAALKALSYIKKERNHYMRGYFEFAVSKEGKIYFLDYKIGFPKLL